MARVLNTRDSMWYDELKAVSFYSEGDLEDTISQHLKLLFPDFIVFPFKKDVRSQSTGIVKRADLAMVRKDIGAWGVIEVELSGHDIQHVLDQTIVFLDGAYNGPEMALYIQRQINTHCGKKLPLRRLETLVGNERPSVLVMVDSHSEEWCAQLEAAGVAVCVFEIYKNTMGRYVYRTSGRYPVVPAQEAHCRAHASISNMLEVVGNFIFKKLPAGNEVAVTVDDRLTRWAVLEDGGKRYLKFVGRVNPLYPSADYGLFADNKNRYFLRKT